MNAPFKLILKIVPKQASRDRSNTNNINFRLQHSRRQTSEAFQKFKREPQKCKR